MSNNVIKISDFKRQKEVKAHKAEDFGDRLSRIRSSLDKINRLMADLKRTSKDPDDADISF